MNKKSLAWMLGASLSFGVSASVFAERIDKKDVPDSLLPILQAQMPAGSKKAEYHVGERDGQKIYELRFETPGGEKTKAVVSRDGKLLQAAAGAPVPATPVTPAPVTPAPITPAVTPATPAITPLNLPPVPASLPAEQARQQLAQLRAQEDGLRVQYDALDAQSAALVTQHNALEAAARAGDQNAVAQRQRLVDQRNTIVTQQREIAQQIVQLDGQEAKVAAAGKIQNEQTSVGTAIGTAAGDHEGTADVHYARAQRGQIPPAALASLDKFTNGNRDLWYRSEEIGGKQSYGVHYVTPENKRYWASAYPSGEVRIQPRISIYQPGKPLPPGAVPPDFPIDPSPVGAVADNSGGDLHVQTISREQVPPAALAEIDKLTKGNKNVEYRKDTKGNTVSYTTHYVSPDNKRYFATVSDGGKVIVEPRLSNTQPTAVKATPAAAPAHTVKPATPATPAAGALKPVANAEVPKAVSSAMMKATDKLGPKDWQFFRVGQDDFAAHFNGKDGKAYEIRVDDSGKVLSGPTAIAK